ncbi:iron-sulfur cluster co-chaperone protein mitochondrial-like [Stylonychia lemnae]|uniref:Iron-sulfur cluster co-chaperone protein mitochondrial-like n=1 Tax=Stylonychia lemnae TaxID=5949 RepID=A0A078AFP3_STYLE|nr:iron-sulfur cluster co-chaperone protein mitochondrial-like [Stylonychia lemnae]|eukprot:CDW81055.1 iron-sulfur cluster co-chaperone protein mitochondrial-like [Stylonychia lemnae]
MNRQTIKHSCNPCKYLEDISQLKRVDYFQFFCLPQQYNVDLNELNQHYKQYQKFIHPDKFSLAADQLQENSTELSSFANNAYFTLINDLQRAIYLLKLKGVNVMSEDEQTFDMEFIEIIFSIRMDVDQCENIDELKEIHSEVKTELDVKLTSLKQLFEQKNYDDAKAEVERVVFLEKVINEIQEKEMSLKM